MSYKYLLLDSQNRDRNLYPNPAEFDIAIECTKRNLVDPILRNGPGLPDVGIKTTDLLVAPQVAGVTSAASLTLNTIILDLAESMEDDFYNGLQITVAPPAGAPTLLTITDYDGATRTATLSGNLLAIPGVGNAYSIAGVMELAPSASTQDDFYNGCYLIFNNGAAINEYRQIANYDGDTRQVRLVNNFDAAMFPAAGDTYEVVRGRDAWHQMVYTGTQKTQLLCYEIELLHLILPDDMPWNNARYLGVELRAKNTRNSGTIQTNNGEMFNAQFIVPVNENNINVPFLFLDKSKMRQTLKFRPDDILVFRVFDDFGRTLAITDTSSPDPPDPALQVAALFQMKDRPLTSSM